MSKHGVTRRRALTLIAGGAVAFGALTTTTAHAASPTFTTTALSAYGGEPSLISDNNGVLYTTTPAGPVTWRSTDKGASWQQIQSPDNNSGDDCLGVDESNALYWCNLGSHANGSLPLQADVWKSTQPSTCSATCGWVVGKGTVGSAKTCSTSCNPFGVDRQWTAASIIPPATDTAHSEVVLMYHDFYGPSHIWVNISHDGGATFGAPQEVLSEPAVTPGGVIGTLTAEGYTFCNTVPIGTAIAPQNTPHAGRIYVSWIASDAPSDASGCNISQAEAFHTLWVSYSDDNGVTWTPHQAFDAGVARDASSPFAAFTIDFAGNPYIGFTSQAPGAVAYDPAKCAAESAAGTLQADNACSFNTYVVWSNDGGTTWDGGGGVIPGSAASAYKVNPDSENGTDVFPTIAALAPGQVDVGYLHTDTQNPVDAAGKFMPGGCAGPGGANPSTYPAPCPWNLYQAQSVDLTAAPGAAHFVGGPITLGTPTNTTAYMHVGDICNLGIACAGKSNRHLLDFNQETIDPTTGCAHIVYADDHDKNVLVSADQQAGCLALPPTTIAESPWAILFVPAAAAAAFIGHHTRRRRAQRAALIG